MSAIRLGYVGCGFMAQKVHLPNFASLPGCTITALAEIRKDLRETVGSHFGIPRLYEDHLQLAEDPDIDAVALSAEFSIQNQMAEDLLKRGKSVFMEKPMATSLERARAILDAEAGGGGRLMVGYMKRYDSGNQAVKQYVRQFLETGEIGPVTYIRNHGFCGDWTANLDTPLFTSQEPYPATKSARPAWLPEDRYGSYIGYLQQYTHNINLVRWLLDAGDRGSVRSVDLDDDGITGVVVLDVAGSRAVVESGGLTHYRWDEHTQVYFRDGWVKTDAPPLLLRNVPADVEVYRAGAIQEFTRVIPKPSWEWSYKREAEHFLNAVRTGEPFDSGALDTYTDVRLFEEIYRKWLTQKGEI